MEAHLSSSVSDQLLESLNFRPPGSSANYVLETRKVRYFAEASDTFGPNSRVIRFRLVDQGFWEPASSRIQFTLHNKDASNALVPIAGPLAMFSRIRVFVSGIQVENWDFVGESAVLTDRLKGAARRQNDSVEHHLLTTGTGDVYQSNCGLWCSKSHVPIALQDDHDGQMDANEFGFRGPCNRV